MSFRRHSALLAVGAAGLLAGPAPACAAGISTDGSLGGVAISLTGPNFAIPANLGQKNGPNLFHSFKDFNIATGESATFSGPADVQNILARVTGGSASTIDGLLASTISGANLFLINPGGVVFGKNASVDVSGAFVVTTGDQVGFTDGSNFSARPGASDAVLTSAPPSAFGFLSANTGAISVEGSQLSAAAGKTWAFAGGDVQWKDATLKASGVVIRGGRLTMDNSKISISAQKAGDSADVNLRTSADFTNQSAIAVTAFADFPGTNVVRLSAPRAALSGASSITSLGSGGVKAGNISVAARWLGLTSGGRISANTFDAGAGGDIVLTGRHVSIAGLGSGIGASASDVGPSGNVRLDLSGRLKIEAGGSIQTSAFGSGAGGNIRVAAQRVTLEGGSSFFTAISADTQSAAPAGRVRLDVAGQLTIAAGAQVSSDTFSSGAGGDVRVNAQRLVVDGRGGAEFTAISTETQDAFAGGPGGNIRLNIWGGISLLAGGQVTASTFGPGAGGGIAIHAGDVFISGRNGALLTGLNASSANQTVGGPGGDVRLSLTGALEIVAGGRIAVSTFGPGAGGSVRIIAPAVLIAGQNSGLNAQTFSGLNGGRGGDLTIQTGLLIGRGHGGISASTAGSGAGGSIDLTAERLLLDRAFQITADTTSPAVVAVPVAVADLEVSFDLDYANDQNLDLSLFGPDGTLVNLFSGVGGNGQGFHGTTLADNAPTSIAAGAAPFTGRFQPLNPLAAFNGNNFNGLWVLVLTDPARTAGLLNSWSLTVGANTISTPPGVTTIMPNPDGSGNNVSFIAVNLPPAAVIPITPGAGGDVRIDAGALAVLGGARISARTLSAGPGGSVSVKAGAISISGAGSVIDAESTSPGPGGNGGDVFLSAKTLEITGAKGSETGVSAKSLGGGMSGSVRLQLGHLAMENLAFIGSSNAGSGNAGSVLIKAAQGIALSGGSVITTSAATGDAGIIDLQSGQKIELSDRSKITASAGANGGSIQLAAAEMLYLLDSELSATAGTVLTSPGAPGNAAATGNGGNISVQTPFVVLNSSLISANAAIGRGGNISILSDFFFNSESLITATGAQAGTINIAAPELDLSGSLISLPGSLIDASTRLQERCATALQQDFSSFITVGRGGIAPSPDEFLLVPDGVSTLAEEEAPPRR